jgi:hypothetical protein
MPRKALAPARAALRFAQEATDGCEAQPPCRQGMRTLALACGRLSSARTAGHGGRKAFGKYADGELDGYWEWWRENGKPLQAGAFDRGKQVGPWKRYYENGQLWDEGGYADGVKVGEWKVYQKTGETQATQDPQTQEIAPSRRATVLTSQVS